MANSLTTQILEDGPRNVVVNIVGALDTSDVAVVTVLNPATLTPRDPPFSRLSIVRAEYSIADTLGVNFFFDATADVLALALSGRGDQCYENVGGIPNNAGVGVTGQIQMSTVGWTAGTRTFTVKLHCKKY
jgi:hypothetical protein